MANRYVSSVDYGNLTKWAASHAYTVGTIIKPLTTPAAGKELAYRCTTAGTSAAAEPTWPTTAGGTVTETSGPTWTEVTSNATYNGASWATAPFGSLQAAGNLASTGDTYYVGHDHSESTAASLTISLPGTATAWSHTYCVNRLGSFPPVSADLRTTAVVGTSGSNSLTTSGFNAYFYGISFVCGSGAGGPTLTINSGSEHTYEQCNFTLGSTSAQVLRLGADQFETFLLNCTWTFGTSGSQIALQGARVTIDGPSSTPLVTGPTFPSYVFGPGSNLNQHGNLIRNADLSNIGSGNSVYDLKGVSSPPTMLVNCKLPTGSNFTASGGFGGTKSALHVVGCNSGTTTRNEIYSQSCYLFTETTIVRSGGASDGTTSYSWKLAPQNSSNNREIALTTFEGEIWNDVTGVSKTLTVHLVTDNIALNSDEIWLEVDYLGSTTSPLATRISTEPTRLAAGAAIATDSGATWTTAGLTTPLKQMLQVTFTPQEKGPVRWRVRYAKSGSNTNICYVCPKAELV